MQNENQHSGSNPEEHFSQGRVFNLVASQKASPDPLFIQLIHLATPDQLAWLENHLSSVVRGLTLLSGGALTPVQARQLILLIQESGNLLQTIRNNK